MEHFIRIAFWIVTISSCLQAKSIRLEDLGIKRLRTEITCVNCLTTALDCVQKELAGTVKEECDGQKIYIEQAIEFFERVHQEQEVSNCERWPQKPFLKFLDQIDSNHVLQIKE
uniref:Saposin B-type domain-containing protein n=1 Tax=Lates calcarifer TaxID=8187 RepID=A0A4W6BVW4_LATCA